MNQLQFQYKDCISETILKSFQENKVVDGEICIPQKEAFYAYLHENKRTEHDNLVAYMKTITDAFSASL
jgi:hypothetical protein